MSSESELREKLRKHMNLLNGGDRVYGRYSEESILMNSYYASLSVSKNSPASLLIIRGESGMGKTRLAEVLRSYAEDDDGFFIRGKFDQSSYEAANLPYSGISNAFAEFCAQLEERPDEKERIVTDLKTEIPVHESALLCDALPSLKCLLQDGDGDGDGFTVDHTVHDASRSTENRVHRFNYLLRKFVSVMTSLGDPIIFLLDDMQWSDSSSLDLIKTIAASAKNPFIFAFTHRPILSDHPFIKLVDSLEKNNSVSQITLNGLTNNHVHEMVCSLLGENKVSSNSTQLAKFLCHATNGNPLLVRQQLISLFDKKMIRFDDDAALFWDLSLIEKSNVVLSSLNSMTYDAIKRLPEVTQLAIQICACIGSEISYDILGLLARSVCCDYEDTFGSKSEPACVGRQVILPAIKDGLMTECPGDRVLFIHDSVQSAAYEQLEEKERAQFHWKLGQILKSEWQDSTTWSPNQLFIISNQLARGCEFVQEVERMKVIDILLRASEESKMVADFRGAHYFYGKAIEDLLCNADWIEHYRLCCDVYLAAAENALWANDYHHTDRWLNVMSLHTKGSTEDQLKALLVRVNWAASARGMEVAIDVGLKGLRSLVGIKIIPNNLKVRTLFAMTKTRKLMKGHTSLTLLGCPRMSDKKMTAALQVMNILAFICSGTNPKLVPLVCFKIVELNLKHGISPTMPHAMAWYGAILLHCGYPATEAFKYGEIALSLQDTLRCNESKSQIAAISHGMITSFSCNMTDCLRPLHDAHVNGLHLGDVRHAMICALIIGIVSFHSGQQLADVASTLDRFTRSMREYNTTRLLGVNLVYEQVITKLTRHLQLSRDEVTPKRTELMISATSNTSPLEIEHVYFMQVMLAYILDDYGLAWQASEKIHSTPKRPLSLIFVIGKFFCGMTALALAQTKTHHKKARLKKMIKSCRNSIKSISKKSPTNFTSMRDLMEAEYLVFSGRLELAEQSFTVLVTNISHSGRTHMEAIAWERFGHYHLVRGNRKLAYEKLRMAHTLYTKWGACQKCNLMERKFKDLLV